MTNRFLKPALMILVLFTACAAWGDCPKFSAGHKVGVMQSAQINEASGMAASRKNAGVLYVHNDNWPASVFAITQEGKLLGMYKLEGAEIKNWEDIAIGPGPEPNVDYLYVGDIGDNKSKRKSITVYRVAEPNVPIDPNQKPINAVLNGVEAIKLVYPDGPRDAETLMLDPLTKDLYIVSKEGRGRVYRAAYPQSTTEKTMLEYVAELSWGTATGGDISRDGQLIIVRGYFGASVWVRPKDKPMWTAFSGKECEAPIIFESQGEAICFDANGNGYYTTSEHRNQPIYYFAKKQ